MAQDRLSVWFHLQATPIDTWTQNVSMTISHKALTDTCGACGIEYLLLCHELVHWQVCETVTQVPVVSYLSQMCV